MSTSFFQSGRCEEGGNIPVCCCGVFEEISLCYITFIQCADLVACAAILHKKLGITMKKVSLVIPLALLAMTGCSKTSDYSAPAGATGEQIFTAACAECHEKTDGKIFELSADKATVAAISKKVSEGGMMMPSFPGIKGDALTAVSQYVAENSQVK